jgi:hypothetical protein
LQDDARKPATLSPTYSPNMVEESNHSNFYHHELFYSTPLAVFADDKRWVAGTGHAVM